MNDHFSKCERDHVLGSPFFLPSNKRPLDVGCDLSTNALVLTIRIAALEKPVRASARAKEIYKWGKLFMTSLNFKTSRLEEEERDWNLSEDYIERWSDFFSKKILFLVHLKDSAV